MKRDDLVSRVFVNRKVIDDVDSFRAIEHVSNPKANEHDRRADEDSPQDNRENQ
jgi:hypothetical protein